MALAVPLLAVAEPASAANDSSSGSAPTQVNVTKDTKSRYGEPEIAVNPKNPNNMVYTIMQNKTTYACETGGSAPDPNCTFPEGTLGQPLGFWKVPAWYDMKTYYTVDGGKTWKNVETPRIPAYSGLPGELKGPHTDMKTREDPMITVAADGTFYLGFDIQKNANVPPKVPPNPLPYSTCCSFVSGGIAVTKSTDGGKTWSTPYLTGTGVDRPWMTADLSTGTIYEASSGAINGLQANGNPAGGFASPGTTEGSVLSSPPDRYVVSTKDGKKWTTPVGLGVHQGDMNYPGSTGATISAANGELVAGFRAINTTACTFFVAVATAPCTVFETSTDSGATWSRHAVPVPADSTGSVLVAADPTTKGTSTLVVMDSTSSTFLSYVTHDDGATWSGPTDITDNASTLKFKSWINYSPDGLLGLAWRSRTTPGGDSTTPYQVFAATSEDQGTTWSAPLQITKAPSPGSDPQWLMGDRDDTSVIALSKKDVVVGWGDWTPGDVAGYFSRIKRQAFTK